MAPCKILSVSVDYNFYERLNNLLKDFSANVEKTDFSDKVEVLFSMKAQSVDFLREKLTDMSNGSYLLTETGEKFAKI